MCACLLFFKWLQDFRRVRGGCYPKNRDHPRFLVNREKSTQQEIRRQDQLKNLLSTAFLALKYVVPTFPDSKAPPPPRPFSVPTRNFSIRFPADRIVTGPTYICKREDSMMVGLLVCVFQLCIVAVLGSEWVKDEG